MDMAPGNSVWHRRGQDGMTVQSKTALYIACNPKEPGMPAAVQCQLIVQDRGGAEPKAKPKGEHLKTWLSSLLAMSSWAENLDNSLSAAREHYQTSNLSQH
jgi:hypothetical protein